MVKTKARKSGAKKTENVGGPVPPESPSMNPETGRLSATNALKVIKVAESQNGATLSGKTTTTLKLCEELAERGFRVGLVPEFVKTVAKEMGFSKVEDVRKNPEKYFQFELEVLLRKLTLEERLRDDSNSS